MQTPTPTKTHTHTHREALYTYIQPQGVQVCFTNTLWGLRLQWAFNTLVVHGVPTRRISSQTVGEQKKAIRSNTSLQAPPGSIPPPQHQIYSCRHLCFVVIDWIQSQKVGFPRMVKVASDERTYVCLGCTRRDLGAISTSNEEEESRRASWGSPKGFQMKKRSKKCVLEHFVKS